MGKPVNKPEFWKERLEKEGQINLHWSVFQTTEHEWDKIAERHIQLLREAGVSGNVLDAGCGYGRMSTLFNPSDYLGIDISPDLLAKAKELYPEYRFELADLTQLRFVDKEFDWAFLISIRGMVIRELGEAEWLKMEAELKRVAKNVLILEYGDDYAVKL